MYWHKRQEVFWESGSFFCFWFRWNRYKLFSSVSCVNWPSQKDCSFLISNVINRARIQMSVLFFFVSLGLVSWIVSMKDFQFSGSVVTAEWRSSFLRADWFRISLYFAIFNAREHGESDCTFHCFSLHVVSKFLQFFFPVSLIFNCVIILKQVFFSVSENIH
jgi:hypothetical protein